MKEIICSETSTAVLKNLLKVLEILFGKVDLKCFTITDNAKPDIKRVYFIRGTVETACPQRELKFSAEFRMVNHDQFGIILNPTFAQALSTKNMSDKSLSAYLIWNAAEFDLMQIGDHSTPDGVTVWLEGNSANNRWNRPASHFETTGLCFDI